MSTTEYAAADDGAVASAPPMMVHVVAPSSLPEGYTFEAQVGNDPERTFTVEVPAGGVKEGDTFLAPLPSELADGPRLRAPTGQWKDGLFNCFGYGILHPHFCCSLWCTQIAMGQAMERMNLTWLGVPGAEVATRNTFKVVVAIVVSYTVYSIALEIAGAPYGADPPSYISIPRLVGSLAFTVWAIWALMKTRASVRAQYQIPERSARAVKISAARCCAPAALSLKSFVILASTKPIILPAFHQLVYRRVPPCVCKRWQQSTTYHLLFYL